MEEIKTHEVTFFSKRTWFGKKEWFWKIVAENKNYIAGSSEGYRNRKDCEYNAKSTAYSLLEFFNQ